MAATKVTNLTNKSTVDRVAIQKKIRDGVPHGCFPTLFRFIKPDSDYSKRYIQGTVYKKYAAQKPPGVDILIQTLTLQEWSVLPNDSPRRITINVMGDHIEGFSSKVKPEDLVVVTDFSCGVLDEKWEHEDNPMQEILFTNPSSKFLRISKEDLAASSRRVDVDKYGWGNRGAVYDNPAEEQTQAVGGWVIAHGDAQSLASQGDVEFRPPLAQSTQIPSQVSQRLGKRKMEDSHSPLPPPVSNHGSSEESYVTARENFEEFDDDPLTAKARRTEPFHPSQRKTRRIGASNIPSVEIQTSNRPGVSAEALPSVTEQTSTFKPKSQISNPPLFEDEEQHSSHSSDEKKKKGETSSPPTRDIFPNKESFNRIPTTSQNPTAVNSTATQANTPEAPSNGVQKQHVASLSSRSTPTATVAPRQGPCEYKYTPLNALPVNAVVNVFGVVEFCNPAKAPHPGRDWSLTFGLCDLTSIDVEKDKLRCVAFAASRDALPRIEQRGDVVRLHRVRIQMDRSGRKQGCCSAKNGFGSLVWLSNGQLADLSLPPPLPISSTPNFTTVTTSEKERLEDLRQWARDHAFFASTVSASAADPFLPPPPLTGNVRTLEAMISPSYFDLCCQVVDVCVINPGLCAMLRVWDGTQPQFPMWEMDLDSEQNRGPIDRFHPVYETARHWLVDVVVWENHLEILDRVRPGSFVLFRNLHFVRHREYDPAHAREARHELNLRSGTRFGRGVTVLEEGNPLLEPLRVRLEDRMRPAGVSSQSGSSLHALTSLADGVQRIGNSFSSIDEEVLDRAVREVETPSVQGQGRDQGQDQSQHRTTKEAEKSATQTEETNVNDEARNVPAASTTTTVTVTSTADAARAAVNICPVASHIQPVTLASTFYTSISPSFLPTKTWLPLREVVNPLYHSRLVRAFFKTKAAIVSVTPDLTTLDPRHLIALSCKSCSVSIPSCAFVTGDEDQCRRQGRFRCLEFERLFPPVDDAFLSDDAVEYVDDIFDPTCEEENDPVIAEPVSSGPGPMIDLRIAPPDSDSDSEQIGVTSSSINVTLASNPRDSQPLVSGEVQSEQPDAFDVVLDKVLADLRYTLPNVRGSVLFCPRCANNSGCVKGASLLTSNGAQNAFSSPFDFSPIVVPLTFSIVDETGYLKSVEASSSFFALSLRSHLNSTIDTAAALRDVSGFVMNLDHALKYLERRTKAGRPIYLDFGILREKVEEGFRFQTVSTEFSCLT